MTRELGSARTYTAGVPLLRGLPPGPKGERSDLDNKQHYKQASKSTKSHVYHRYHEVVDKDAYSSNTCFHAI